MELIQFKSKNYILRCIWLLFVFSEIKGVACTTAEQDLTLTMAEKKALDELKARVIKDLPNDWMKTEVYLSTWVRAAGRNVARAERLLRQNLRWRQENKMDNILNEDYSTMEEEFPIDLDGVDYFGRPVIYAQVGEWDIRRSHIMGIHEENYRYTLRAMEQAAQNIRDAQKQGKLVTRFNLILDLKGFSLVTHGCLQCVPPYLKFITEYQNFYPELVDNIIFINAPQTIEQVLKFIRPIARPSLRKILHIFGTNKKEWQTFLFKLIPKNQLDTSLGGTRRQYPG